MRFTLLAAMLGTIAGCASSASTGLARCNDSPSDAIVCARLGEEFDLRVDDTAYITDTDLSVRVVGVPEDSRCPSDVTCVWAGNARVWLTIRDGARRDSTSVNSTLEPHAATRFGYTVRLLDVRPPKVSGQEVRPSDYIIRLVVTRA